MSSSRGPARRSGDPRRRTAAAPPSREGSDRRRVVVAAVAVGGAVLTLALLTLQPDEPPGDGPSSEAPSRDPRALTHAAAACDLTTKAGEAAEAVEVDERSRYAAAVLLLDRAIIESARAAESDSDLTDLDTALQAVHTAGHEGDPDGWQAALDTALAECRTALG